MAIKISKSNESFKVIVRSDDALPESLTEEAWENYKKTLDETVLGLTKEPTRFVLRRHLPFGAQKLIANEQLSVGAGGKPTFQFGYMLEEVRCALTDIENPADLPEGDKLVYKTAADGFASHDLIALLNSAGIVAVLFAIRQEKLAAAPAKK